MNTSSLDWQKEIHLRGFAGILPEVPIEFSRLQHEAERVMSPNAYAYVAGGAGTESTLRGNSQAFEKYRIVPRMMKDVGNRDLSIELFGKKLRTPLILSPIGVLELVHPEADLAVARASRDVGVPFIFSNQASKPMEACAAAMDVSPRWFQLYWSKSRELIKSFIKRAEHCGCTAIVVTLDTTLLGWRTRDLDLGYLPFLEGKGIAQYTSDPIFQKMMDEPDEDSVKKNITLQSVTGLIRMTRNYPGNNFLKKLASGRPLKAVRKFVSTYSNPSITWDDLQFLRSQTKIPILLKGIVHPADAKMAIEKGMDGIIVSNHGGRQVDGAIAALDALPSIVDSVQEKIPVIFDSGVRGGADVFKALALGARGVCIGRPYVYGLALRGEQGVRAVLKNFITDFELTMALAGCKNTREISRHMLSTP